MHSDFVDLLRLLNRHRVRYLVIGGYAYSFHAEPRYTKDLDLWVEASPLNAARLLRALSEFGAPVDNLTKQDLAKPGLLYVFGVPPLRVDVLNRLKRCSFGSMYKRREIFRLRNLKLPVVSRQDLCKLKRAAGRPQDLADLAKLSIAAADGDLTRGKAPKRPKSRRV